MMNPYVIKLLEDTELVNDCLICKLTPSQIYANIKGVGKAHRFIWEQIFGPVPEGTFVCHKCDVPRCINPNHLFLGTPLDNMLDKVAKGRQHLGGPGKTINIVSYPIIASLRYDGKSYDEIAEHFKVDRRTVSRFLESCPHD